MFFYRFNRKCLLVLTICFIVCTSHCLAVDWIGDGTLANPYQISTPDHLMTIGANSNLLDKHFILVSDIIFDPNNNPEHVFTRALIAPKIGDFIPYSFTGSLDGRNYEIQNLKFYFNSEGELLNYNIGLIGRAENAIIKNLNLRNYIINADPGVYAMTCGSITANCSESTISNCSVEIQAEGGKFISFAGIVGKSENSLISGCSVWGYMNLGSTGIYSGGLIGECYDSTIRYGSATIEIVSGSHWIGGIAGICSGPSVHIYDCYSNCNITASESGGLVGYHYNTAVIENCYATGSVNGGGSGGLIGIVGPSTISRCVSRVLVSNGTGNAFAGGIFPGTPGGSNSPLQHCYFLEGTAINQEAFGTPLTENQMKQRSSYSGFDFVDDGTDGVNNHWRICSDGIDYPRLSWEQSIAGDFACPEGIGFEELLALCNNWLMTDSNANFNFACDGNRDGQIDFQDFSVLSENW